MFMERLYVNKDLIILLKIAVFLFSNLGDLADPALLEIPVDDII